MVEAEGRMCEEMYGNVWGRMYRVPSAERGERWGEREGGGSIIGEMGGGEGLRLGFGTGADPNLAVNSEASRKIDLDRA